MSGTHTNVSRRSSLVALLGLVTAGCGGGGGGSSGAAPAMAGSTLTRTIGAQSNGTSYPLSIYLPPNTVAIRANLPTVYLLDGESRFQTLVDIVETMKAQVMIVAIGNEALRARDYVPANTCTPGGGGQAAFLQFIGTELVPFVEASFPSNPQRRILLGHSHGGSFVIYAFFNEVPASRLFASYLASDSSIDCMSGTVSGWESAYAAANTALPVRLHVSYSANVGGNVSLVQQMQSRHYTGLTLVSQIYGGGHTGMIPAAFTDALTFALA
jgi:predicted alpha/beta superfamily hydrolase